MVLAQLVADSPGLISGFRHGAKRSVKMRNQTLSDNNLSDSTAMSLVKQLKFPPSCPIPSYHRGLVHTRVASDGPFLHSPHDHHNPFSLSLGDVNNKHKGVCQPYFLSCGNIWTYSYLASDPCRVHRAPGSRSPSVNDMLISKPYPQHTTISVED